MFIRFGNQMEFDHAFRIYIFSLFRVIGSGIEIRNILLQSIHADCTLRKHTRNLVVANINIYFRAESLLIYFSESE